MIIWLEGIGIGCFSQASIGAKPTLYGSQNVNEAGIPKAKIKAITNGYILLAGNTE